MFIKNALRLQLTLGLIFSAQVYAECPKEDVTYYLKQGFNQEQIVQLCTKQNSTSQKQLPSSIKEPEQKSFLSPSRSADDLKSAEINSNKSSGIYNPDAIFLASAIEAYDLEVTKDVIMLTRKDCFEYGQEDWNEFQDRACPNVKYTISRDGLEIVDRDNGFFGMGSTALYIAGTITAEIVDLDQFQDKQHEAIKATIQNSTKKLKINIRSGMPQDKVEGVLLKLAN